MLWLSWGDTNILQNHLLSAATNNENQIILENSQSEEKNALRTNITDTLQKVIEVYSKNRITDIIIFEIGKTYFKEHLLEQRELQVLINDSNLMTTANKTKKTLRAVLKEFGINNYTVITTPNGYEISANYESLGFITNNGFRIYTQVLMKMAEQNTRTAITNPNTLFEDISVVIPLNTKVGDLYNTVYYFDPEITEVEVKAEKLNQDTKNVIFRIYYTTNFANIKQKLIEKLKEFPNLEMRS
jgi:phenylalanyl-tRNA synthetase beta subunit